MNQLLSEPIENNAIWLPTLTAHRCFLAKRAAQSGNGLCQVILLVDQLWCYYDFTFRFDWLDRVKRQERSSGTSYYQDDAGVDFSKRNVETSSAIKGKMAQEQEIIKRVLEGYDWRVRPPGTNKSDAGTWLFIWLRLTRICKNLNLPSFRHKGHRWPCNCRRQHAHS